MKYFFALFVVTALACSALVAALLYATVKQPRDNTDAPGGVLRSGMTLRTDAATGCQYLETRRGGITPRLNSDGRQVCEK